VEWRPLIGLAVLLTVGWGWPAWAKPLETSFVTLSVPESWECEKIKPDWACRPTDRKHLHSATLVLTAKVAGPEDTLSAIEQQMKAPRTFTGGRRTAITSQLRWAKQVPINGQNWVEALHHNRELEGFFTYYLATVTPRLVILVNLSFQQELTKEFEPILAQIRGSVQVSASALEPAGEEAAAVVPQPVGPAQPEGAPTANHPLVAELSKQLGASNPLKMAAGAVLVLLAIVLLGTRRRSARRSKRR
jgi:hypothetical protein